jgi:hypothetical protein
LPKVQFEPWSRKIKDYEIGICCFSAKQSAWRNKSNNWLRIRIICPSSIGAICLPANCCFSELAL